MSAVVRGCVAAVLWGVLLPMVAEAGMPAPLPTTWTAENADAIPRGTSSGTPAAAAARWQAVSFFVAGLLLCAAGVKWLWNVARHDVPWLPPLRYGRAVSLVVLWGLAFVIVLTMISGARELMTPGAWRKQGWTYRLTNTVPPSPADDPRAGLERLRQALWHYAATHAGRFPAQDDSALDRRLWDIPGRSGLWFLSVPGRTADQAGRLLVYEPERDDGGGRLVLLTNGLIGTMPTADIEAALAEDGTP